MPSGTPVTVYRPVVSVTTHPIEYPLPSSLNTYPLTRIPDAVDAAPFVQRVTIPEIELLPPVGNGGQWVGSAYPGHPDDGPVVAGPVTTVGFGALGSFCDAPQATTVRPTIHTPTVRFTILGFIVAVRCKPTGSAPCWAGSTTGAITPRPFNVR